MNKYILWRWATVIADSRQDGTSERRRKTTTVLTAVWTGRPDSRPCVASFRRNSKSNCIRYSIWLCYAYCLPATQITGQRGKQWKTLSTWRKIIHERTTERQSRQRATRNGQTAESWETTSRQTQAVLYWRWWTPCQLLLQPTQAPPPQRPGTAGSQKNRILSVLLAYTAAGTTLQPDVGIIAADNYRACIGSSYDLAPVTSRLAHYCVPRSITKTEQRAVQAP